MEGAQRRCEAQLVIGHKLQCRSQPRDGSQVSRNHGCILLRNVDVASSMTLSSVTPSKCCFLASLMTTCSPCLSSCSDVTGGQACFDTAVLPVTCTSHINQKVVKLTARCSLGQRAYLICRIHTCWFALNQELGRASADLLGHF